MSFSHTQTSDPHMEQQLFKDVAAVAAVAAAEYHSSPNRKRKSSDGVSPRTQMEAYTYDYERSVEIAFHNQKMKYSLFKLLLNGLIAGGISEEEVMKRMNILFQGHGELLLGLERFLSWYHELKTGAKLMDAANFVRKIKERYGGESTQYNTFLGILTSYKNNPTCLCGIYDQAARLFEDQPDLLEELTKFLPVTTEKKG